MVYDDLTPEKKREYDRKVLMGLGELVEWSYVDLEEVTTTEEVDGKKVKTKTEVPVKRMKRFFVGRMTLFQTSAVLSILTAVFANGQNFKAETGRSDNLAFIEYLDEYHLSLLLSTITDEQREWFLSEAFDVTMAIKVIAAFLKYNNFFGLLAEVQSIASSLELNADSARTALLGK